MKVLKFDYEGVLASHGKRIADAAKELSDIFTDGYYLWLAGLWDKESGGFYYANSSRDNSGFLPDIESTAQAMVIIRSLGLMDPSEYPEEMRRSLAKFAKGLQDPIDGYFYHPQWGKDITTSRRSRDLNNAISVISDAGDKPDYPTALDRLRSDQSSESTRAATPQLASPEALIEWLKSLDFATRSYPNGHILDSMSLEIKAAGLAETLVNYMNSIQHPETGLWEERECYASANGMLKISTVYPRFGLPFPNALNAAKTQIRTALSDERTAGIVDIYNPWVALGILYNNARDLGNTALAEEIRGLILDSAPELLDVTRKKLLGFIKPDGSFSYCHMKSSEISQGAPASLGLFEGDVNASALALITRAKPYEVLGIDPGPMTDESDRETFIKALGY